MGKAVFAAMTAAALVWACPTAADYAAGTAAYQRGDRFRGLEEFRRAAESGDGRAQLRLGQIYQEGTDVLQDFVIAHMWYDLAAAQEQQAAAEARDHLAKRMTAEQIARSRDLTRQRLALNEPPRSTAAESEVEIGKEDIVLVQQRLAALGFDVGKADGKMGKRTRNAIREYQRTRAIPTTGEVDRRLIASLKGDADSSLTGQASDDLVGQPRHARPDSDRQQRAGAR